MLCRHTLPSVLLLLLFHVLPSLALSPIEHSSVASSKNQTKTPHHLDITTIYTNSHNNSAFACWRLKTPFTVSSVAGVKGAANLPIGAFNDVSVTVIPAVFEGGLHNAPVEQLVVFLSGKINITLPHSSDFALLHGGKNGIIAAVDTVGTGHISTYVGKEPVITLQMPFKGGNVVGHEVLYQGPCRGGIVDYN